MLLKDAVMEFDLECKVRRLAKGTIENYGKHLGYLLRYLEDEHGIIHLEEVKAIHIKRFLLDKEEQGRKPQYMLPHRYKYTLKDIRGSMMKASCHSSIETYRKFPLYWGL